jgi:hypothetical protein
MRPKQKRDVVDVVAQKIRYDLIGDELHTSTCAFHTVEPDQPSEPTSKGPYQVCVEFDADVPGTVVVHALRTVLDTIEKDGLPQLVVKLERADAARLMKIQQNVASLSKQVAAMSPELRDAFDRIAKQQGLNWGNEIAVTQITKMAFQT